MLLKRFFKVHWSPILIPFKDGDYKNILKNLKQQFMSVIKLKLNLCTTHIELSKNFGREGRETDRNDCCQSVFLCEVFINWRILTWIWKTVTWAVYFSRSTHTTSLELILGNWYLASYNKMKHLESNCIWNFLLHIKFLNRVR